LSFYGSGEEKIDYIKNEKMKRILLPTTEMDFIALKVVQEYNQMKNIEYSKVVLEKIGVLLKLINSLHEEKVQLPSWQIWVEAVIHKLAFHSVSLLKLFEGTEIPFEKDGKKIIVLDKPSIVSLLRVVTENFLTFNYLYSGNTSDDEKQFRLSVWRYCGIKQRTEFDIKTENAKNKQNEEIKLLADLKNEVINSSFFSVFTKKQQETILDGKKARLFYSWTKLIKESGLRTELFKNMYGYKSNYSHSEFISVLQVHAGNYIFNPNAELEIELMLLHILICKSIINLKETFSTINNNYEKLDSKTAGEIKFINLFGSVKFDEEVAMQ
jgi:hypothetical protein